MNMMNMALKTAKEAITASGLNWKVAEKDVLVRMNDDIRVYQKARAIVREDNQTILGIVGTKYRPIQNEEAFAPLDEFVSNGDVLYKSANSYNGGRVVSMDLSLTREAIHNVRVGDDIETVIRVVTSHDGSQKFQARLLMNRLVCKNGMVRPNTTFAFSVKHTEKAKYAIRNGWELINVAQQFGAEMAENARKMAGTLLTRQATEQYINQVLGIENDDENTTRTDNKKEEILALGVRGKGNNGSSLWDAYNGVTEYADHHISVRGENDRLASSTFGSGLNLKERAYTVAQEFIAV